MYTQHDIDLNEYLLSNCFVDAQKFPTVLSLDKQEIVHNGKEYLHFNTFGWFA